MENQELCQRNHSSGIPEGEDADDAELHEMLKNTSRHSPSKRRKMNTGPKTEGISDDDAGESTKDRSGDGPLQTDYNNSDITKSKACDKQVNTDTDENPPTNPPSTICTYCVTQLKSTPSERDLYFLFRTPPLTLMSVGQLCDLRDVALSILQGETICISDGPEESWVIEPKNSPEKRKLAGIIEAGRNLIRLLFPLECDHHDSIFDRIPMQSRGKRYLGKPTNKRRHSCCADILPLV